MKLVEPGPQPPPFKVEYSALEADAAPAIDLVEETPEGETLAQDTPAEGILASETVEEHGDAKLDRERAVAQAPPEGESAAADQESPSEADSAVATAEPQEHQSADEQSEEDAFGTGIDVEESPSKPDAAAQPGGEADAKPETVSAAEPATPASENDSNRKKGKRPNRRRRSRRGQKEKDGPPASGSDS